jgi:hypothetical protein
VGLRWWNALPGRDDSDIRRRKCPAIICLTAPITACAKPIAEAAAVVGVAIAARYGRNLGEVTLKPAHSRQE